MIKRKKFNFLISRVLIIFLLCVCSFFVHNGSGAIFIVNNTGDSGAGSLRDQLTAAAASAGKDTIRFAIPGIGKQTITPLSSLPAISDSIFIDGYSQAGVGNVNIVLDGVTASGTGLSFQYTSICKVEGIEFRNFSTGILVQGTKKSEFSNLIFYKNGLGIQILTGDSNVVANNYLLRQTSPALMIVTGKENVLNNNTIDSTAAISLYVVGGSGNNKILNNQVSNGSGEGIYITGGCENNQIQNNQLTKCSGGIYLTGGVSSNSLIGNAVLNCSNFGITIESGSHYNLLRYNTIGGSSGPGLKLTNSAQWNIIQSNFIGTNNLSANLGNTSDGVLINNSSYKNSLIGNVIGFNQGEGIYNQADSTIIDQNRIGIDSSGNTMGNTLNGVMIFYGIKNLKVRDNYICNNLQNGIYIRTFGTDRNELNRNILIGNGVKSINLDISGTMNGNNNKKTPYITKITKAGTNYTLKIYSELNDQLFEVFRSDATNQNTLEFLSNVATSLGGNYWQMTVTTNVSTPKFLVTARNANFSTSELGYDISEQLIVVNTNDAGSGSLRNAIDNANLLSDTSAITFNIPGTAPYVIQPVTQLPDILYCTKIDASSQPGIELKGNGSFTGLVFFSTAASGSELHSFYIHDFSAGAELRASHNVIIKKMKFSYNNYSVLMNANINTIIKQTEFSYNQDGLSIAMYGQGSVVDSCTLIHNTNDGITISNTSNITISNNFIYSNGDDGIFVNRVTNITINNNVIGVDSTGKLKRPNNGDGMVLDFNGTPFIIKNNVIGGNGSSGISLTLMSSVYLFGNYIGTNSDGDDLGNGTHGISIASSVTARIGGLTVDSSNVIGFNVLDGIHSGGSGGSKFVGNYVGVDRQGRDIHNFKNGIYTFNTEIITSNNIAYNKFHGVYVAGNGNSVQSNKIGTDLSGNNLPNLGYGIVLLSSNNVVVGNSIAANDSGGIYVDAVRNKISQTTFTNTFNKAIELNFAKDTAAITAQVIVQDTLTLSGTGITDDSVEVFVNSTAAPQEGAKYVGIARIVGGVWSLKIPAGPGFSPLQDNYYTTTSRDALNTTSEFSAPYKVGVYLCNSATYNVLPDSKNICSGDSILLSATLNGVQYQWYFNNDPISTNKNIFAKKTGLYKVVLTDANSCTLKDSVKTTVLSTSLESDFLVSSVATLQEEVVVIDVSYTIPQTSTWDFGVAQFRKEGYYYLLTYPDTGQYTISLVSTFDGCERKAERDIHIINEQNISDPFQYAGDFKLVKVHPNPNDGIFYAEVSLYKVKDLNVKLYNNNGTQLLLDQNHSGLDSYNLNFDISSMESGAYLLKFTVGQTSKGILIIRQ